MSKILVKMCKSYADEFDCEAFQIFDDRAVWESVLSTLEDGAVIYFGSNEELGDFCRRDFTVTEISDEEAAIIQRLLGREYGTGSCAFYPEPDTY